MIDYFMSLDVQSQQWLFWLALGVFFIFAEMITPGFILIFFGAGALLAGLTAFSGFALYAQMLVFGVSSVVLLVFFRKTLSRTFQGDSHNNGDSAEPDSALGALAEVTKAIDPPHPGSIKFQGSFWQAYSSGAVAQGEMVRITARQKENSNAFVVEKET